MIYAKVVAHSKAADHGKEICTFELQYPRFIHGELLTHRVFSRNAMSSRAIPVQKMIEQVRNNPVIPIHWGANQPGMQATAELGGTARSRAIDAWREAATQAAETAQRLCDLGLHKQIANRVLEPFQWMRTLVTATEFDNFFALRCHPDAEPHIQDLAYKMQAALADSTPIVRARAFPENGSGWHLPYVLDLERQTLSVDALLRVSAARCARVSYLTHGREVPSIEADLALFARLAGGEPIHASPLEHQALPFTGYSLRSRNFIGWTQWREAFEILQEGAKPNNA